MNRKRVKWVVVICTIIYVILFPFFFYMALLSTMVFDNPHMTVPLGSLIILVTFCIPLSMPISIYLMWSKYCRLQYKKAGFFCILPLLTFGGVYLMLDVLPAYFSI
jgi:hypothetical protein